MPSDRPAISRPFKSSFLTPDVRDFILTVRIDSDAPAWTIPEVGSPLSESKFLEYDRIKYGSFKFLKAVPSERGDGTWFLFYGRDREDQEAYAYEISYPYGSESFPRYNRTLVIPREDYVAAEVGSVDPVDNTAVLVAPDEMVRLEDPVLDAYYVMVRRTYDRIPDLADAEDAAIVGNFGYSVAYPYHGDVAFPRVTWTTQGSADTFGGLDVAPGSACPVPGFTSAVLVRQEVERTNDVIAKFTRHYELVPGGFTHSYSHMERLHCLVFVSSRLALATEILPVAKQAWSATIPRLTAQLSGGSTDPNPVDATSTFPDQTEALPAAGATANVTYNGYVRSAQHKEIEGSPYKQLEVTWLLLSGPEIESQRIDKRTNRRIEVIKQAVLTGTEIGDPDAGTLSIDIEAIDAVVAEKTLEREVGGGAVSDAVVMKRWNDIIRASVWEVEVHTADDAAEPTIGGAYDGRTIVNYVIKPSGVPGWNVTTLFTVPTTFDPYTTYPSRGFSFPAIFDFLLETVIVEDASDLNRPGVVYNYEAHRTGDATLKRVHIITNGEPDLAQIPDVYRVSSPGSASRVFPMIRANTIHPAFTTADENGILEVIPASSPANYRKDEVVLASVSSVLIPDMGNLYLTILEFACESGFVNTETEGSEFVRSVYLAESADGGFKDPQSKSKVVLDAAAGDSIQIWGTADGSATTEAETIGDTGPRMTSTRFNLMHVLRGTVAHLSYDATIRAAGQAQVIRVTFAGNPTDGDTFQFEVSGSQYAPSAPYGYQFVNTLAVENDVLIGATLNDTLNNLSAAINLGSGSGTVYHADTEANPFMASASRTGVTSSQIAITDSVKMDRTLSSSGDVGTTTTVTTDGENGALIARIAADSGEVTLYNRRYLKNPDRRQIIPPGLSNAPTEEIDFGEARTVRARYVMSPEISLSYEVWNGSSWQAGATFLETVTGDDTNSIELEEDITKLRFKITNSSDNARMLQLDIAYRV